MPYICPVCQSPLKQHKVSNGYACTNKHHFDQAKEGYLNLLPVQYTKSKHPGDSLAMIRSRRHFLEAGYYQPLAKALAALIDKYRTGDSTMHILDTGCGEGYYSRQIETLCQHSENLHLHGIDIAKNAISAAAKKQANAHFIVASSQRMPYADAYFDLLLKVYAPANDEEILRILKLHGFLLLVTPGPRHLWQLKEFIYKKVTEHKNEIALPNGFKKVEIQTVRFKIQPDQEQRMALLQMTPFSWRATEESKNTIQHANGLEIETEFNLTLAVNSRA